MEKGIEAQYNTITDKNVMCNVQCEDTKVVYKNSQKYIPCFILDKLWSYDVMKIFTWSDSVLLHTFYPKIQ